MKKLAILLMGFLSIAPAYADSDGVAVPAIAAGAFVGGTVAAGAASMAR